MNSSCVILFLLLISTATVSSDFLTDMACAFVNCGEGTCKPTNLPFPPVHCECNSGWKEPQLGTITFPICIPNCTLDFGCGAASPPPPPAPLAPPTFNFTDPCALSWCNEGTCVAKDSGRICQCNLGADNLMNNDGLPCFKECVFGADCNNLGFGVQTPPPTNSGSNRNGPSAAPNSSSIRQCHLMLLLVVIYMTMF